MSGFRVIESGLRGFPPVANSKRKIPVLDRVKTEAWSASETAEIIF